MNEINNNINNNYINNNYFIKKDRLKNFLNENIKNETPKKNKNKENENKENINSKGEFTKYANNLFQLNHKLSLKHTHYKLGNNSNTRIKTDFPYSNSDISNSDLHNSSQRTFLLYDQSILKKFNTISEDTLNNFVTPKFKNRKEYISKTSRNKLPAISNNNLQCSFNLSNRDENKRISQYINYRKSRNQKKPIKILSTDNESLSDPMNSNYFSKTWLFNTENINRSTMRHYSFNYRNSLSERSKNNNIKPKNFSFYSKKLKSNNNLQLNRNFIFYIKNLRKKKNSNANKEKKIFYLTDSELQKKRNKNVKENYNERRLKTINLKTNKYLKKKVSQLSKISESGSTTKINDNSFSKNYYSDEKKGKISNLLLNKKNKKNIKINHSEKEITTSDNNNFAIIEKKTNSKICTPKNNIDFINKILFNKKLNKLTQITEKKNLLFKNQIIDKIKLIDNNRNLKKENLYNVTEHIIISYKIEHEKRTENNFDNKFKDEKSDNEYIKELKIDKHLSKISLNFEIKYITSLCSYNYTHILLNQYYIQKNLLEFYFLLNLYELIFIHKYIDKTNEENRPLLVNFSLENAPLSTLKQSKKSEILFFEHGLKQISFQNFTFIWKFCRLDFEFFFGNKPIIKEEKELSKRRASVIFSILKQSKKGNNKFLGKTAWKFLLKTNVKFKDSENKDNLKLNKSILRNALRRNDFYIRESKIRKKR